MRSLLLILLAQLPLLAADLSITHLNTYQSQTVDRLLIDQQHLYAVSNTGQVTIYAIADLQNPKQVGTFRFPANEHADPPQIKKAQMDHHRLYLTDSQNSVAVFDLTIPNQPVLERHAQFEKIYDTHVENQVLAFKARSTIEFIPMNEAWCSTASIRSSSNARLSYSGRWVLISTNLYTFSPDDFDQYLGTPQTQQVLTLKGDLAIKQDPDAPYLIELDNTIRPSYRHRFTTPSQAYRIYDDAILGWSPDGMVVHDLTPETTVHERFQIAGDNIKDYTYSDGVIAVTNPSGGFTLYDLNGEGQGYAVDYKAATRGMEVAGDVLYLAEGANGLSILDISQPGNPQPLARLLLESNLHRVTVQNQRLYGATATGLVVIDVENPAQPAVIGQLNLDQLDQPMEGPIDTLIAGEDLVFLAGKGDILVVDTRVPEAPVPRAMIKDPAIDATPGLSWRAPILELGRPHINTALALTYPAEGLIAYDLTDPDQPVQIHPATPQLGASQDWRRIGDWYYGAVSDGNQAFLDVIDTTRRGPVIDKSLRFQSLARNSAPPNVQLAHFGEFLLMSCDTSGIRAIDISQGGNPQLRFTQPTPGTIGAMKLSGDRLFAFDLDSGALLEYQLNTRPARLVVPWVVNNDAFDAKAAVYNDHTQAVDVLLRAVDRTGQTREKEIHIPAQSVYAADAESLFGDLTGYSLTLFAATEKVHASFLIFNREPASGGNSPSQTTAQTINDLSSELVFGYVPGDQTAAVVLTAPNATDNTLITLSLYDQQQGVLAQSNLTLTAMEPTAALVTDLFPNLTPPPHATLVARARGDTALAGVTFVFNEQRQPSMAAAVPVTQQPLTHLTTRGTPAIMAVAKPAQDHIYTAANASGLEIHHLTDDGPTLVHRLPINNEPVLAVETLDQTRLVVLTQYHCLLMSLADPTQPQILDQTALSSPRTLAVDGERLFIANHLDLYILDIADNRFQLASRTTFRPFRAPITKVAPDRDRLHILGAFGNIDTYDLADPANPVYLASNRIEGEYTALAARNNLVAITGVSGLRILDFQDPEEPQLLFTADERGRWLDFDNDLLWQGRTNQLLSIDLHNPAAPVLGQPLEISNRIVDGEVMDGHVFMAGPAGLEYIDLDNPPGGPIEFPTVPLTTTAPSAQTETGRQTHDKAGLCTAYHPGMALFGVFNQRPVQWCDQDLTAVLSSSIKIFRLDNEADTACLLSTIPLDEPAGNNNNSQVALLEDSRIYTTDYERRLSTWDLTDPAHPKRIANTKMPAKAKEITRKNDLLEVKGYSDMTYVYRDGVAEYLIPWVVANQNFSSRIALFNQSGAPARVRLEAVDRNGRTQQQVAILKGGGSNALRAKDLFPDMNGYSLRITSNIGQLHVSFLTLNVTAESGGNAPSQTTAAAPPHLTDTLIFSYIPGNEVAALVLTAGETQADPSRRIPVHLTLHNASGPLAEADVLLTGNQPLAALATDLFPQVPADAAVTAQTADGATIAGVTFVFNQRGQPSMARAVTPR